MSGKSGISIPKHYFGIEISIPEWYFRIDGKVVVFTTNKKSFYYKMKIGIEKKIEKHEKRKCQVLSFYPSGLELYLKGVDRDIRFNCCV